MKFVFLFILFFNYLSFYPQEWSWAKTVATTTTTQKTQATNARKICSDDLGNFFILGSNSGSASFGSTVLDSGGFVEKFDAEGNILWAKKVNNYGREVLADRFGNLFVLEDSTDNITANYNIYKYSAAGALIWKKSFIGWALAFVLGKNGDLYVTGNGLGSPSFFLTKINSAGVVQWTNHGLQNDSSGYGSGYQLCLDKNETVYVTGSGYYANCMNCNGSFLAKFDTLGNQTFSDLNGAGKVMFQAFL